MVKDSGVSGSGDDVRSLNEMERFNENPFSESLVRSLGENSKERIKRIVAVGGNDMVIDGETGEVKQNNGNLVMAVKHWVDEDQFIKLYINEIGLFFSMTKSQQKLFKYILNKLEWNKDYFYFDAADFKAETGMSYPSIYKGLALLCNVGLIARSKMYIKYFINPVMMFKGDRIIVAKEYIRAKDPMGHAEEDVKKLKNKSGKFLKAIGGKNAK